MTDTNIGERAAIPKTDAWAERIAWRKRLQKKEPIRFALVDRGATRQEPATEVALELVMASGERLRISAGVDAATLRTVMEVLRP